MCVAKVVDPADATIAILLTLTEAFFLIDVPADVINVALWKNVQSVENVSINAPNHLQIFAIVRSVEKLDGTTVVRKRDKSAFLKVDLILTLSLALVERTTEHLVGSKADRDLLQVFRECPGSDTLVDHVVVESHCEDEFDVIFSDLDTLGTHVDFVEEASVKLIAELDSEHFFLFFDRDNRAELVVEGATVAKRVGPVKTAVVSFSVDLLAASFIEAPSDLIKVVSLTPQCRFGESHIHIVKFPDRLDRELVLVGEVDHLRVLDRVDEHHVRILIESGEGAASGRLGTDLAREDIASKLRIDLSLVFTEAHIEGT